MIYLDSNASTAVADEVIDAITEELKEAPSNPSSVHTMGQRAKARMLKARQTIAHCLNVKPSEIIFTSGGTESMNLLIQGFCQGKKKGHIISSNIEHSCVRNTLNKLEADGFRLTYLPVGLKGYVEAEELDKALQEDTILVTISAANGETGVKNDIEKLSHIAKKRGIAFVVDGVAALGKEPMLLPPGVSGAGFSGHKIHGPKGVGFCFVRSPYLIHPLFFGGSQECGLRPGTENLPAIKGLAKAVEMLSNISSFESHMRDLRDYFEEKLKQEILIEVNGEGPRICNVSNVYFPGIDGETLLILLDKHGICASHGSACSSGSIEPSRVLIGMEMPRERAKGSIRFSLSRYTTKEDIDGALGTIISLVKHLKTLD